MNIKLLHPALVHFPIAFYFLELVLLVLWTAKHDPAFRRFALFSFRLGYFFMLLSMASGWLSTGGWSGVTGDVPPHFYAACAVFALYTVRGLHLRFARAAADARPWVPLAGALVGNALVTWTALLGGKLVYS